MTDVHAWADELRQYATHFEMRDWRYTRHTRIRHIRLVDDWSGYDHPVRRLGRFVKRFTGRDQVERDVFGARFPMAWKHPLVAARTTLWPSPNLPDGALDGGGIITHWEETGEYLQYVQPSVGALLADLMDAHPDLPEVRAIANEMRRINDDYADRIASEESE